MGNLVDSYILCPLYEVDNQGIRENFIDKPANEILVMLQSEIDRSFLSDVFNLSYQVIDLFQHTTQLPDNIWAVVETYEADHSGWRFSCRFRQDSFLQRIRKLFFSTLMVIENDYDSDKQNRFIIVHSDDILMIKPIPNFTTMTEDQFSESRTEDQKFCELAMSEFTEATDNKEKENH